MSYTLLTDPMRFPTLHLSAEPVDEKPAFSEPSYLLGLPDELKLEIASYVGKKSAIDRSGLIENRSIASETFITSP